MSTEGSSDRQDPHQENRALIDDVCHGCCSPNKYCTLKEILARSPRDARTMIQIKCIEKLKYERSSAAGNDIGWRDASDLWIREGYAEAFARLYRGGMKVNTIYTAVMKSTAPATPPAAAAPQSPDAPPQVQPVAAPASAGAQPAPPAEAPAPAAPAAPAPQPAS